MKSINDVISPNEVLAIIVSEAAKRKGELSTANLQAIDGLKPWADFAMAVAEGNRDNAAFCLQILAYIEIALQIKAASQPATQGDNIT